MEIGEQQGEYEYGKGAPLIEQDVCEDVRVEDVCEDVRVEDDEGEGEAGGMR